MAYTEMSLPIDIPWKRIGVSEDMIDPTGGDIRFPGKWRSSIAVFSHEPAELPPEYCDRKITYLKIVCTITNYQPDDKDDVTALDWLRKKYADYAPYYSFDSRVTCAYPCYGALLQVAVFPNPPDGVALHDFPYISAFQPRKREMYEVLTESGEVLSQSGNKINVSKGTTNTDTAEDYDVQGGGFSAVVFQQQQKQFGKIDRDQNQAQDIRTTDTSREKRESYSYSTNLSQLYSLLQGYHLGTNRALFFMQPRPHMQDTKFTFVRGLRRLEGIQEFFLIVNRPASVPGLCVEVALETAHFWAERGFRPRLIPESDLYTSGNLSKTALALGVDLSQHTHWTDLERIWNWNSPLARYWASVAVESGEIPGFISGLDDGLKLMRVAAMVPGIGTAKVALIFEECEEDSGWFFVVGRRLYSCAAPAATTGTSTTATVDCERSDLAHVSKYDATSSIVFTKPYPGPSSLPPKHPQEMATGLSSNTIVQDLNESLWSSLGSSDRYAYGEVSFLETEFVLNKMSQLLRLLRKSGTKDRSLGDIEGLHPLLEQGLGKRSEVQTLLKLGTVSTEMLARDLAVTKVEARKIRRDLLTVALAELDATTIDPEIQPGNPIQEMFAFRFPNDKLRDLERSAGLDTDSRVAPEPRS